MLKVRPAWKFERILKKKFHFTHSIDVLFLHFIAFCLKKTKGFVTSAYIYSNFGKCTSRFPGSKDTVRAESRTGKAQTAKHLDYNCSLINTQAYYRQNKQLIPNHFGNKTHPVCMTSQNQNYNCRQLTVHLILVNLTTLSFVQAQIYTIKKHGVDWIIILKIRIKWTDPDKCIQRELRRILKYVVGITVNRISLLVQNLTSIIHSS
jgi:hypothetical protein